MNKTNKAVNNLNKQEQSLNEQPNNTEPTSNTEPNKEMCKQEKEVRKQEKEKRRLERKVTFKNIIITGLVILVILLLFRALEDGNNPFVNLITGVETTGEKENKQDLSQLSIDIPLITDFTVTKSAPYLTLFNPETNKDNFYLQYTITVAGKDEPIYISKMVEPADRFSVDIKKLLPVGIHTARIYVKPYAMSTLEKCNGATMDIQITVK